MKKLIGLSAIMAVIAIANSCKKTTTGSTGTVYLDLPTTAYNYDPNPSTTFTNKVNEKATLGRVLFYDTHLSLNNAISCGSCHHQTSGFADNVAFSVGYEGRLTGRNSRGFANITGTTVRFDNINSPSVLLFWDGRENTLQNLIGRPITNHVEMGITDFSEMPAKLSTLDYYKQLFTNAYGSSNISTDKISECVAIFVASITSHNSRFDQFMGNSMFSGTPSHPEVYTANEYAGFNLFINKYHCQNCHRIFTSYYSSADMLDIGLDQNYFDKGYGTITGRTDDNGKFRTPGLRNVALTAPYMHDGRFKTLDDVLNHYSHGINNSPNLTSMLKDDDGKPKSFNISDADKEALIAFLNTLTDYTMITDPKYANPFKAK
jgi:cytochrome c peroxidase